MREIVDRLHENRQIELAKSILESHGYEVSESKLSNDLLDKDHGEAEQGSHAPDRRGRKPNGNLKDDGVFTPGSEEEKDHKIHENEDEWDPYKGKKYKVVGEDYEDNVYTDDPKEAIEAWFKLGEKAPMDTAIMTKTKASAVELVKSATEELLTSLHSKYKCPYRLDYMIQEVQKKVADGQKYFHELRDYGDSIHPFGVG